MKSILYTGLLICWVSAVGLAQVKNSAFKNMQLKNQKVKEAYDTKWQLLNIEMEATKINMAEFDIYIRVFKTEKLIEIWLRNTDEVKYRLFKTYDICSNPGELGPRRTEEDKQLPEGFYKIDVFNPKSSSNLSMKINYPNSSDVLLKKGLFSSGSVILNGDCSVDGGITVSDEKNQELYILCMEARNRNQPIYIDIYPAKFTDENLEHLETNYSKNKLAFWKDLKNIYDFFEENKWLPAINVDKKGHYVLSEGQASYISQTKYTKTDEKH